MIKKNDFSIKLNRTDWQILIFFYTISLIVDYFSFPTFKEFFIITACNTIVSIFIIISFIYWIIPKYIIQKTNLFFFSINVIIVFTIGTFIDTIFDFISEGKTYSFNLVYTLHNMFRLIKTTGLLLGVLLVKKFYESQVTIKEIEKARKENELKLLRKQLSPHFLFNNLNSLNALIYKENKTAREYTNKLSNIYRYLIQTKDEDVIELQKELDFAENYIFLIKTRFKDSYSFNFENSFTDVETKFVLTGAIQTLLENVIKHNKTTLKVVVLISINITDDYVTVKNTKTNIGSDITSFGTGLDNLQKRYTNISNKSIIINDTENYFSVSVPILNLFD